MAKKAASSIMWPSSYDIPGSLPRKPSLFDRAKPWAKKHKGALGSIAAFMVLDRLIAANRERAERGVRSEALQAQGEMASPENLYYQAALPQAQAEESQARQALLSAISGGILGPSLPQGYRVIGG